MSYSVKRARKIADLIRQNIALLIKKEVNDSRLANVSIISVDLSADLGNAKIYYYVADSSRVSETEQVFNRAKGFLRCLLADSLGMRYVPKLNFVYDKSIDHGSKMSDLIQKARDADNTSIKPDQSCDD